MHGYPRRPRQLRHVRHRVRPDGDLCRRRLRLPRDPRRMRRTMRGHDVGSEQLRLLRPRLQRGRGLRQQRLCPHLPSESAQVRAGLRELELQRGSLRRMRRALWRGPVLGRKVSVPELAHDLRRCAQHRVRGHPERPRELRRLRTRLLIDSVLHQRRVHALT